MQYVLEGSVQPPASRIRVNAQFIDAKAARISGPTVPTTTAADLLQMEDDIVTRLARTLDFDD